MDQGMVTVFMGSAGEAAAVCAMLQSRGVPAFIPDDWVRTWAPFDIGGLLVFDRAVQVPPSAAERARAIVESHDEEPGGESGEDSEPVAVAEEELPAGFFDEPAPPAAESASEAAALREAEAIGRRVLWAAVLPIGLPFVLFQIGPYLRAVKRSPRKPALHRATLTAAWLSPLWLWFWAGPMLIYWAPWLWDWIHS